MKSSTQEILGTAIGVAILVGFSVYTFMNFKLQDEKRLNSENTQQLIQEQTIDATQKNQAYSDILFQVRESGFPLIFDCSKAEEINTTGNNFLFSCEQHNQLVKR